jgi:hypothetical protein
MRRVLSIAAMLLMIGVACKNRDNEVVEPPVLVFEVETDEFTISHEAQEVEIAVVSNQDVSCDCDLEWINVLSIDKKDNYVVVLRVDANVQRAERAAEISLHAGDEVRVVKIVQMGMPEVMQVIIAHRNQHLESPEWGGEAVSGSVDWGDDTSENYVEGMAHDYAHEESYTATFTMSGATSFRIDRIGAMDGLTIAVN